MNTKFEQLLDYLVNEEMDKANELFHEIVVEKSRDIYQNLINEEEEEDEEEMDESMHDEEEMDESADEEELDESDEEELDEYMDDEEELEDSYSVDMDEVEDDKPSDDMMGGDDMPGAVGGDETDDLLKDVEGGSSADELNAEIDRMMDMLSDFKEKVDDLAGDDASGDDDFDMGGASDDEGDEFDDESDDEEKPDDDKPMFEGRRLTREYREKVGNDWEKNSQKAQGKSAGADTGEKMGSPAEGKSPIASGKNKPGPAGVNAKNLNQGATEGQSNTGTSPGKVTKGLAPHSGEKMAAGLHNVDGKTSGVKTLSKVAKGHGAEKHGSGPGPIGSGTGDKAGQTSVGKIPQFLKPAK